MAPLEGNEKFTQYFGTQYLSAPVVTSFQITDASDSGAKDDGSTNVSQPVFIGQVRASFPGSVSNVQVLVQFNGLHNGILDLNPGGGGRGFVGSYDVLATTDANGTFMIQARSCPKATTRSGSSSSVSPMLRRSPASPRRSRPRSESTGRDRR